MGQNPPMRSILLIELEHQLDLGPKSQGEFVQGEGRGEGDDNILRIA